jgi:hypothetical protein
VENMFRRWINVLILTVFLFGCSAKAPEPPLFKEITLTKVSQQQAKKGYDVLGLAMYCQRFLEAPRLQALSTLLNTFGDPLPCVEKAIQRNGYSLVQIDLIDATCWRNNKCPAGVPRPTDLKEIKKRSQKVFNVATRYPHVEFWVSPALEHDEKNPNTVRAMLKAAKDGCPICQVINSPFSGARVPEYPLELHGTKVRAFSVSGDGASIFDADNIRTDGNGFEHNISGNNQTYAWWNELNLRCTGEKNFTPPLKRTEKPSGDQFWQAYLTMQPEPGKPSPIGQCRKVREVKKPEIYKPNAESYCNGQTPDRRGNKPLLIIKKSGKRGDKIKVFNKNGKQVGCFSYYGSFTEPGLHRWYMGDCSGQTPYKLYKDFGDEWGFVQTGGGECILLNSVRRMGSYR